MRFPIVNVDITKDNLKTLYHYKDRVGSYLVDYKGKPKNNLGGIQCHVAIRTNPSDLTNLISSYRMEVQGAPELWDYLTSPEGPFKKLIEFAPDGWELIANKDKVFAFKMPDKCFKFKPYPLVYAFLICTRMPSEYPTSVETFKYLIDKGIDKNLSFLMTPYVAYDVTTSTLKVSSYGGWNGSHQALAEWNYKYLDPPIGLIDINKFSNGEFNTENIIDSSKTRYLWSMSGVKDLSFSKFSWGVYGTETKSKFGGTVVNITDDGLKRLIEDLNKYIQLRY